MRLISKLIRWLLTRLPCGGETDSNEVDFQEGIVMSAFEQALAHTLGIEGGYSDDKDDSGGKTNYGITVAVARKHGYKGSMKDLPLDTAKAIYKADYWDANSLTHIAQYNESIALEMFDTGVNQGVRRAGKYLQRALNVLNRSNRATPLFPDLKVDGLIGAKSRKALVYLRTEQEQRVLLTILNVLQGSRYVEIIEKRPSQEKYSRGWFDRVEFRNV